MTQQDLNAVLTAEDIYRIKCIFASKPELRTGVQMKLEEFSSEYQEYARINFSIKYCKSIRISFKHLKEYFDPSKLLSEFTIKDADDFISSLITKAPQGTAVYLRNIKAAFNKALDWEYIDKNPFAKVKVLKQMRMKPDFLNEQELELILNKIKNEVIKNIIETAFYTGARLEEVVSLRQKNIDFQFQLITIGDSDFTTKSRKQRVVPINQKLKQILIKIISLEKSPESFVFEKSKGFNYTGEYVSKQFKKACREAGIRESIHFHSLRHSFGTILGQKGAPIITVKELMGHSSITTTQIYSHASINDMIRAVNLIN